MKDYNALVRLLSLDISVPFLQELGLPHATHDGLRRVARACVEEFVKYIPAGSEDELRLVHPDEERFLAALAHSDVNGADDIVDVLAALASELGVPPSDRLEEYRWRNVMIKVANPGKDDWSPLTPERRRPIQWIVERYLEEPYRITEMARRTSQLSKWDHELLGLEARAFGAPLSTSALSRLLLDRRVRAAWDEVKEMYDSHELDEILNWARREDQRRSHRRRWPPLSFPKWSPKTKVGGECHHREARSTLSPSSLPSLEGIRTRLGPLSWISGLFERIRAVFIGMNRRT